MAHFPRHTYRKTRTINPELETDRKKYRADEVRRLQGAVVREAWKGTPLGEMVNVGLPHAGTIARWMDKDPVFHDRVARAYSVSSMMKAQECVGIADHALDITREEVQAMVTGDPSLAKHVPDHKNKLSHAKLRIGTRMKMADRALDYSMTRLELSKEGRDANTGSFNPEETAKKYCAAIMMAEPDYLDALRKGDRDKILDYIEQEDADDDE